MIYIKNTIIPFRGYEALTVWPFIFVRSDHTPSPEMPQHEAIHGRQQLEMLVLPFFVWYGIEWIIKSIFGNYRNPYREISFEKEAYENEKNSEYLKTRKFWRWIKYL